MIKHEIKYESFVGTRDTSLKEMQMRADKEGKEK